MIKLAIASESEIHELTQTIQCFWQNTIIVIYDIKASYPHRTQMSPKKFNKT